MAIAARDGNNNLINLGTVNVAGVEHATSVPVDASGNPVAPLTDAQLRATAVPVSGTVAVSGTVPVSGPLTDAQLRATAVPVSLASVPSHPVTGPLTDAELRASAVPVSLGTSTNTVGAVRSAPGVASTFNQSGAISANTDLLIIDCAQFRAVSVQCTSIATSGVVTAAWSNTNVATEYVNATLTTPLGGQTSTFNAAGLWTTKVCGRYLRLRMTTGGTLGNTILSVIGFDQDCGVSPVPLGASSNGIGAVTQSGTWNIGSITTLPATPAGTNLAMDVGIQARANATGAATIAKVQSAASTNATAVKASAGRVLGWHLTNTSAAAKVVHMHNLTVAPTVGTSVPAYNIVIAAGQTVSASPPAGIAHSTGISYSITGGITDLDATAVAANDVVGLIYYA